MNDRDGMEKLTHSQKVELLRARTGLEVAKANAAIGQAREAEAHASAHLADSAERRDLRTEERRNRQIRLLTERPTGEKLLAPFLTQFPSIVNKPRE